MVADLSPTTTSPKPKLSSPSSSPANPKTDNNVRSPQSRGKFKDVTSRYMSYNSSKLISDTTNSYPNSKSPSTSEKMLTKTSVRSLSVSFQGESFALPVSKVGKSENKNGLINGSPEITKKAPGMQAKVSERSPKKTVDFADEKAVRVLEKWKKNATIKTETIVCQSDNSEDHTDYSDPESIFSGNSVRIGGPRAIVVPARFWRETINLLRRFQQNPVPAPLVKNSKQPVLHDGSKVVPPRGSGLSPASPDRVSNGLGKTAASNTNSILSFSGDVKRGKVGEKKVVDAHVLRVLHNKHMQWRFANARADAAMVVQRAAAQKTQYNAWVTISKLWHSVTSKRLQLQQLKHNLKLHSLLKKQMLYLDNWDVTDRDHSASLSGAIVVLESSSLCLPVLGGAKADIQDLKDAICSAVDVMQAMAVSIYSLLTKVENLNLMASELATAMKTECSLLDECKDLLSTLTLLEKQDCSLRAHTLQLIPAATTTQLPKINMPF